MVVYIVDSSGVVMTDVLQELWKMVVHSLEKIVVLPPLTDPRAVSLSASTSYLFIGNCSFLRIHFSCTLYASTSQSQEVFLKDQKVSIHMQIARVKTSSSSTVIKLKCK